MFLRFLKISAQLHPGRILLRFLFGKYLDSSLVVTVDHGVPVMDVVEVTQGFYQMMYYTQS